jgi:hypothetical protein
MNLAKNIVGWVLLVLGVVLIGWALLSTYNVFTGKINPPEIFAGQDTNALDEKKSTTQPSDIQAQIEKITQEQIKNLMPTDSFSKILNLAAWSILASIFILGGTQISGIGIKLINKQ